MEDKIKGLCENIKAHKCNSCGGNLDGYTCIYCGNEIEEVKHLEDELLSLLEGVNDYNFSILSSLYSIRGFNLDKVNEILKKYEFENQISGKFKGLKEKKEYTLDDEKMMLYFAENDLFDRGDSINRLMSELLNNRLSLSTDEKLKIFKEFTSLIISKISKFKPKVEINNDNENAYGSSILGCLTYNEKEFKKFLESNNYLQALITIFHECTHTLQEVEMLKPSVPDYYRLLQSKESIISFYNKKYYDENYYLYSMEVDARYKSYIETLQYLDLLGIKVEQKDRDKLLYEERVEFELSKNENRVLDGKKMNVHEAFDSIIDKVNPLFLTRYPMIALEYKNDGGKLVRKSVEEIDRDYETLYNNYSKNTKPENRKAVLEELDRLYSNLTVRCSKTSVSL